MIKIVDYGMGNLRSVQKAFERIGVPAEIGKTGRDLIDADALVLPGVGAFRDSIAALRQYDIVQPILDHIAADKPFLGVCLGLQLLFDVSYEDGEWEGLGVIPGKVVRFDDQPGLKVPHMGWNQLEFAQEHAVFTGIPQDSFYYFVHSYHVVPRDNSVIVARSDHGGRFVSVAGRGNLIATQYHPEKSQSVGLKLLKNFATSVADLVVV
ncbi:MAG: imidazole glycerol phosphate synthase subunit HisH [Planctomycetota bacterium]|nr:imidazole glycerol phosphate synthase subunit HisH [Planctomycetota bacterium]